MFQKMASDRSLPNEKPNQRRDCIDLDENNNRMLVSGLGGNFSL